MSKKMKIVELKKNQAHLLKPLLEEYPYKPYHNYFEFADYLQTQYILKKISSFRDNIKIFALSLNDRILAACFLENLDFDTKHFGLKTSEVTFFHTQADYKTSKRNIKLLLKKIDSYCCKKSIRLLVARLFLREVPIIHALEEDKFLLMANTVVYLKNLRTFKPSEVNKNLGTNLKIRPFNKKNDMDVLCKIAKASFSSLEDWFDRFHADYRIPNEKADLLYEVWTRNCCVGNLADIVLVAELEGKVVGYICAKIDNLASKVFDYKIANIPLNAVSSKYRRKGIYMALVQAILKELKKHKVELVGISTQSATIGVQKVWQRVEGWPVQIKHVFHKYVR